MRIITPFDTVAFGFPVVTVGTFDGVHAGHAAVISALKSISQQQNGTSVVLTFDPHPRQYIDGPNAPGLLTTKLEKRARLDALGLDILVEVPFDEKLRQMSPDVFVETYLVKWLPAVHVVVGYDHGFGKNRQGGYETMQALGQLFGFGVSSVAPSIVGGSPISSTRIRKALENRQFEDAVALMGSGFPVWGTVQKGDGRGQGLGFPTANVAFDVREKLAPPQGVYAAWVSLDKPYKAVVNFGQRPTFGGKDWTFEVHILEFSGDLYDRPLKAELIARIRDEQKFESEHALIAQIQKDVSTASELLKQCKP
jgi:riboflavin kinase/FMN adenylyltransferase